MIRCAQASAQEPGLFCVSLHSIASKPDLSIEEGSLLSSQGALEQGGVHRPLCVFESGSRTLLGDNLRRCYPKYPKPQSSDQRSTDTCVGVSNERLQVPMHMSDMAVPDDSMCG